MANFSQIDQETKEKFGTELKRVMNKNNINNKDLADLLNRPHWRISDFTFGKAMPTYEELNKMCDLLNTDKSVFFPNGVPRLHTDKDYLARSRSKPKTYNLYSQKTIGKPASPDEENVDMEVEDVYPVMELGAIEEDKPTLVPKVESTEQLIKSKDLVVEENVKVPEKIENFKEIVEKNDKNTVISKKIEIKIPSMNENQSITILIEEIIK